MNGNDDLLAIHVSRSVVRALRVVAGEVVRVWREEVPGGGDEGTVPGEAAVERIISEAAGAGDAGAPCRIVMALSSSRMVFRFLSLPPAGGKDLERMVGIQAELELPAGGEGLSWDWCRMPHGDAGAERIVICGANRQEVERLRALERRLRVEIELLVPDVFAMARFCKEQISPALILSRFDGRLALCAVRSGAIEYARIVPLPAGADEGDDEETAARLAAAVIETNLYVNSERAGTPTAGHVVLLGEDGGKSALVQALGDRLEGSGLSVAQPEQAQEVPRWPAGGGPGGEGPAGWEVALGLAGLARSADSPRVNLGGQKRRRRVAELAVLLRGAGAVVAAAIVALVLAGALGVGLARAKVALVRHTLQAQRDLVKEAGQLRGQKAAFEKAEGEMIDTLAALEELCALTPPEVVATRIDLGREKPCRLEGTVKDPEKLGDFLAKLNQSPLFEDAFAQHVETAAPNQPAVFTITFSVARHGASEPSKAGE